MRILGSKGKAPLAIKAIIIMMSLLYVMGPMNFEINGFLHTIAHSLEMPDTILSHKKKANTTNIHHSIEHKKAIVHHDHDVIDLVEKILKGADNENKSPDPLLTNHKIDKHITLRKSLDEEKASFVFSEAKHSFSNLEHKLCKGYPNGFSEPPEVYKVIFI